ncbi:unnamed protein product [Polarella glacialis]|uniref:Uncharacterized protein n=1 Tax=Polarella glacialis TaxID=89957 RepID=A0A813LQK0_POLGL|nr:unnamed protein product [Polarella glacialis]
MVAGSKGREEMSVELKPFFQDQAQAESFVEWVEECKWKFLTGGPSPQQANVKTTPLSSQNSAARSSSSGGSPAPTPRGTPPVDFWGPAPTRSGAAGSTAGSRTAKLTPHAREAPPLAAMKPRSGPHVAVTSRVVLQPNPNFDDSPPPMPTRTAATGVAFSKAAAASRSSAPVQAAKPLAPPAAVPAPPAPAPGASVMPLNPAKKEKNELLENMTKQLQLILTKLQDKTLPDESREKYQALAQNIQTQMAKITKPVTPAKGRGR